MYSATGRDEILPRPATRKEVELTILSEVTETGKVILHVRSQLHQNADTSDFFTKQKQPHRLTKATYGC